MLDEPMAQPVDALFALLRARQIDYLLVGGIALLNYVEGRNTEDIDLIIALPDVRRLNELRVESQDANFARATFRSLRIDCLLTQNHLFDYVDRHCATQANFRAQTVRLATVEGLLLLKFYALPSLYRQGDFNRVALYETDVTMLLPQYTQPIETLFNILQAHLSESDLASLREIATEIEGRIGRFKRKQG